MNTTEPEVFRHLTKYAADSIRTENAYWDEEDAPKYIYPGCFSFILAILDGLPWKVVCELADVYPNPDGSGLTLEISYESHVFTVETYGDDFVRIRTVHQPMGADYTGEEVKGVYTPETVVNLILQFCTCCNFKIVDF